MAPVHNRTTDSQRALSSIMDQGGWFSKEVQSSSWPSSFPKPGVSQGQVGHFRGRVCISSRLLYPTPPNPQPHWAMSCPIVSLSHFLHHCHHVSTSASSTMQALLYDFSFPPFPSHICSLAHMGPAHPQEAGSRPFEGGCYFSN